MSRSPQPADIRREEAVDMGETALGIANLRKVFGDHVAVKGFSLDVEPGEFLSLLGPSGEDL